MNAADIDELERLEKAATPGPVQCEQDDFITSDNCKNATYRIVAMPTRERWSAHRTTARVPYVATVYGQAEAELYVSARNALPELIRLARIGLAAEMAEKCNGGPECRCSTCTQPGPSVAESVHL